MSDFELGFLIMWFGFMAAMWAMTRPVKCTHCDFKGYVHECEKGGGSWIAK